MSNYLGLVLIFISTILLSACSETNNSSKTEISKNAVPEVKELVTPVPYKSDKITKENFLKIKNGMTLMEVETIFEETGEKIANDENLDNSETIYEFRVPDGKGKTVVTFKDDKVVKKEQFDLK